MQASNNGHCFVVALNCPNPFSGTRYASCGLRLDDYYTPSHHPPIGTPLDRNSVVISQKYRFRHITIGSSPEPHLGVEQSTQSAMTENARERAPYSSY